MISQLDLRRLRKNLGVDVDQMAELLGIDDSSDLVKMENGDINISAAVVRLAVYIGGGVGVTSSEECYMPKFVIGGDLSGQTESEVIFHTQFPRFLAVITGHEHDTLISITVDGVEWVTPFQWIDEPIDDAVSIVTEAAALLLAHNKSNGD